MTTVRHSLHLDLDPAAVWAAVRDFGAADRLFAGPVRSSHLDGRDRVVTFADGDQVRERLVTCDDEGRRLVYTVLESPVAEHHNSALEVVDDVAGGSLLTWTTDVLPDSLAAPIDDRMRRGVAALERTLPREARGE